ncbi:MAG TPA: alpha/beta-hydrolase family protein, partial [Actinomycetota bacterium]|nr:alpha/beta-hydrolase family protein [Actinomycetota bacterium]
HLLLVSPTGTGWVDHTMIEAAEFLTRGDIATCCVQYGRYPSFLSVQKVALGQSQFRLLLWGVKQRLEERPPDRRPRVLVFGESLGAWTSSDVVMFQGIEGFDHYGIDRALWVGLPWLAKWSRSGMSRGSTTLVPEGTVGVFDRHEQLAALDDAQRARLRAVILSHDNDPIAVMGPDLIVQRPAWLADGQRGRGVPQQMRWTPLVTFVQTAMDAANAMVSVPGEFGSFGHDYRADMVRFVRDAYALPSASDTQVASIEQVLRSLELERAARIKAEHGHSAPPAPAHRTPDDTVQAGVPLRQRRTSGARWVRGRLTR